MKHTVALWALIPTSMALTHQLRAEATVADDSTALVNQKFDDRTLLEAWDNEQGTFSVWGSESAPAVELDENIAEEAADAFRPCDGLPRHECSSHHMANTAVCDTLIQSMTTLQGDNMIRKAPRDYCLQAERQRCCISWRTPITRPAQKKELGEIVKGISERCNHYGSVSGRVVDAVVGRFCSTVCLSNRPRGC